MIETIIQILIEIFLFVALFLESFPLFGALVPGGAILIFIAGMFSKFGTLNGIITLTVCIGASISADIFGYWIGITKGDRWVNRYSRFLLIKSSFIYAIAEKLKNHPKKALILGKFNPATRSIMPLLVGIKKIKWENFIITSIISSIIWVTTFFLIGFAFGKGIGIITFLGKLAIIVTFISFLLIYFVYLIRQAIKKKNGNNKQSKNKRNN